MKSTRGYVAQAARSSFISAKALLVDAIKYSPSFFRVLHELEKTQWYSRDQFEELQDQKLRALIAHAYRNVPYYRRVFDQRKLTPADIRTAADLKKLPLLDKAMLRKNPDEFVARNIPRRNMFSGWTTGTTGSPLNAMRSKDSIVAENAMIWRQRRLTGLKLRCRKAAVWGTIWDNVLVPAHRRIPPFWLYNIPDNQLLLSYFHMSDETLPDYVRRMESFAPEFVEGFPSTLLILARFLKKQNKVLPLKAIFTSSEMLYDVHRRELEESFATRVFDLYGQAERVVAATECEHHQGLHVNPEYGVFEVLVNGEDAPVGVSGEVVGTGLSNYVMPLIRYRTGDMAAFSATVCSCGRQMPLLAAIQGRMADIIQTPDGRVVPGNGLMGAFHGIANVKRSQVVQESLDHVVINLQREDPVLGVDTTDLKVNLVQCLGENVRIEFRMVDEIDVSGRGKYRWVVSHLSTGHQDASTRS